MENVYVYPKQIDILPFYGGAKGQSLQIIELPDGTITTSIIKSPIGHGETAEDKVNPTELENPPLPSKYESNEFSDNIKLLQSTAMKIIALQESAKENGKLTKEEETLYRQNMSILNKSAENLAKLQDNSKFVMEGREGLSEWFDRTRSKKDKNKRKEEEEKRKKDEEKKRKEEADKKKREEENKKKQQEEEKRKQEEEKKKKEEKEEEEEEEEESDDSVAVDVPPDDASVAEAKPVGLAIAGAGGVAASKPVGTAVVGPGGLAIARPVGTAIAGVPPDQALGPLNGEITAISKPKPQAGKTNEYISRLIRKYHQY